MLLQLLSALLVASVVRAQGEADVTPLLSAVGESITLTCNLEVADPINLEWQDTVYSLRREPAVIFTTGSGLNLQHLRAKEGVYDIDSNHPMELTINDLRDSDIGSYFCVSTLADDTEIQQEFTLGLAGELQCDTDVDHTDLTEGDSVTASCNVEFGASVSPQFDWYLGEEKLARSNDASEFGELSIESTLEATKEMDKQTLACKMSFHGFEDACPLQLSVKHKPYVKMFENSTGQDAKKHSFSCTVSANPDAEINILKINEDDTSSSVDPARTEISTKGNTFTVTFKKLSKTDEGQYLCEASNVNGDASDTAYLEVSEKPQKPDNGDTDKDDKDKDDKDKDPATGDGDDDDDGSAATLASSLAIVTFTLFLQHL